MPCVVIIRDGVRCFITSLGDNLTLTFPVLKRALTLLGWRVRTSRLVCSASSNCSSLSWAVARLFRHFTLYSLTSSSSSFMPTSLPSAQTQACSSLHAPLHLVLDWFHFIINQKRKKTNGGEKSSCINHVGRDDFFFLLILILKKANSQWFMLCFLIQLVIVFLLLRGVCTRPRCPTERGIDQKKWGLVHTDILLRLVGSQIQAVYEQFLCTKFNLIADFSHLSIMCCFF